jgi:outer membrane lipoprotein-sorting protein
MTRDPQIGDALDTLDVPEHGPAFWTELTAAIKTEPVPLAPRRRWKRQALRAVTVAAAASVVAVAISGGIGGDGDGPLAPRQATAAEVARRVSAAFASAQSLRGTLVERGREGPGARTTFVATAKGDVRLESRLPSGEVMVIAYDAERGVEESYSVAGGDTFAGVRTGLAPVQTPDQGPADWVLRLDLAATLRAAGVAPAVETTYDGRPAWLLEADAQVQDSAGDAAYDHLAATIDQATALPVRIVESRRGETVRELTVEGLVTDTPVTRAEFDLTPPPGAQVSRTDGGFRRVALSAVRGTVGYDPLVPQRLPGGFALAEVAVAEQGGHTGPEGLNPESERVVSLAYRRGFERILVTTRLRTPGEWRDPMSAGEGITDAPEPVTLSGALSGAKAELVATAQGTAPHVWALTDTLVVTVSGDLSRDELLDVAGSLAG